MSSTNNNSWGCVPVSSGSLIFNLLAVCGVPLKLCHWDRYLPVGIGSALQELRCLELTSPWWVWTLTVFSSLFHQSGCWGSRSCISCAKEQILIYFKMCLECNMWAGMFQCWCMYGQYEIFCKPVCKISHFLHVIPQRVAGVLGWS